MWVGINHHPTHPTEPQELIRYDTVRYPVWNDKPVRQYQRFTKGALELGIRPLLVMDWRAVKGFDSYEKAFERQLKRYPDVEYWQIGNESDQPNSESSWYMEPIRYRELLKAANNVLGAAGKTLISAGMVSGDPMYLAQVNYYPFDMIAVHPYGQYPKRKNPSKWHGHGFGDVMDLVDSYRALGLNKPIWITEFGVPCSAFDSHADRQLYYEDMLVELSDGGVEVAMPYCHSFEQCGELALAGVVNV